jgi:hypothetical protein
MHAQHPVLPAGVGDGLELWLGESEAHSASPNWPNPQTWQPAPGAWLPQLALLQASRERRSVSHERKSLAEQRQLLGSDRNLSRKRLRQDVLRSSLNAWDGTVP